jgi:hypothetical protein
MLYGGHSTSDGPNRVGARSVDLRGRERILLPNGASLVEHGQAIAILAGEWIPSSDLVLRPEWDAAAHAVTVGIRFQALYQPLVAVLGVELAAGLTSPAGLWSCDGCPYPYTPTRTPRRDRRRFCPTCSETRAPARLWWREHRSKKHEGDSDG